MVFLIANEGVEFEQVELTAPWQAVERAGGQPVLVAPEPGSAQAFNHLDRSDSFTVDLAVSDALGESFEAPVLPGGVGIRTTCACDPRPSASPDRSSTKETGRGHLSRAWTLIEAAAVRDRTLTSWPSLKIDLTNAGAEWVDEPVHVDTNGPNLLISSRKPDDLPAFTQRMVDTFAAAPAGLARS